MNAHKTIYIVSPEFDGTGNMIFRDNNRGMIRGKYVLLLIASATTGRTIARAVECINYYGGSLAGISAIYSAATKIFDRPINALFTIADIPDYKTYRAEVCPMCKNRVKIDAICNGYGYSEL
jgi:orotate phosphoribosyltransferase